MYLYLYLQTFGNMYYSKPNLMSRDVNDKKLENKFEDTGAYWTCVHHHRVISNEDTSPNLLLSLLLSIFLKCGITHNAANILSTIFMDIVHLISSLTQSVVVFASFFSSCIIFLS